MSPERFVSEILIVKHMAHYNKVHIHVYKSASTTVRGSRSIFLRHKGILVPNVCIQRTS